MTRQLSAVKAIRVGRGNRPIFELPPSPGWMADAVCAQVDPDVWFPEKGGDVLPAKRVCLSCPVLEQCRAFALAEDGLLGIWGGLSERERRRLRIGPSSPGHPPEYYRQRAATIRAMAAVGGSAEDIADVVGLTVSAVRSVLSRDRRRVAS